MANELHTMPLKLERLYSSLKFRSMQWDEQGAYLLLLCETWLKDSSSLPSTMLKQVFNNISDQDFERIKTNVIEKCFKKNENDEWFNVVQMELKREVRLRSKLKSEGGKKGYQAKLKDSLSIPSAKLKDSLSIQSQIQSQIQRDIMIPSESTSERLENATEAKRTYRISFSEDEGWIGITDEDIADWKAAYPAVDIGLQLNRAAVWAKENPLKRKKNWGAFLSRWLDKCQERGGR